VCFNRGKTFVLLRVVELKYQSVHFHLAFFSHRCVKTKVFSPSKRTSQHTRKANAEDLREPKGKIASWCNSTKRRLCF